ncbi:MAG TPA: metal ABC transporter ATP-binding protein [Gammaproteobacteria bacterium]|jgi:zinc transport system ATP-binding protein|nr:metal ABC transporter ATP-binding protein [Gammaproteobacteria bacterium]
MTNDGEPVLEVSDLKVTLEGQTVLDHISFAVRRGEVWTILGPNGAGKTVLLRALLGALPYRGSIAWKAGVRIGYVPQRLPYIRNIPLSVAEFFALKSNVRSGVDELLRAVGLGAEAGKRRIGDFSSGQFQRILIAWALASDPDVLLFDEPTAGIDIGGEETVYALLAQLKRTRNLTMLIVTHDLAMVHRLSSMVLCLNRQAVCMGPPLAALTPENLERLFGREVSVYEHKHE